MWPVPDSTKQTLPVAAYLINCLMVLSFINAIFWDNAAVDKTF